MSESKRQHLRDATELVEEAADRASGDAAERLEELAGQIRKAANRSHGPDHGRLARMLTALGEVQGEVDERIADIIQEAKDHLTEFRKTVEGV